MAKTMKSSSIKEISIDRIFNAILTFILILVNIIMLYPFIYVISTAISDQGQVIAGNVWLYPRGFDMTAVKQIVQYPLFARAYLNTIIYSVSATVMVLLMTSITAYPLSRPKFTASKFLLKIYVVTMFFGGGMIPTYLVYKNYGLVDNPLVMIIPGAVSAWNLVIVRTFFKSTIPESLHESACIEGANDWTILWRIVLPLSKPVLATIALFTMVGVWNNFFTGLLYFNKSELYPLQLILRMILINASMSANPAEGSFMDFMQKSSTQSLKAAAIVVSILPIICIYPFMQKYFVKGVMIGSIKG